MDKPTREQSKEVWEWCGFKFFQPLDDGAIDVIYPDGSICLSPNKIAIPEPDLNNLFKYAEKPLVDHFIETTLSEEEYRKAYYDFLCRCLRDYIWNEPHNPVLALFWAIWEVIKEG